MSERKKGSTSVSLEFRLTDVTTGAAKTGLDVTTLKLQSHRPGEAPGTATALTLLAAQTTAWTAYGAKEVDATNSPGIYRVDCPDAAFGTGADEVTLTVNGASIQPTSRLIDLTAFDARDGVRGGLTAFPNVVQGAAGAIPTGDASGRVTPTPQESILHRTGTAQAGTSTTITLDAGASATDGSYVGHTLAIISGTGAPATRQIVSYLGSTKVASVNKPWNVAPDATSVFQILKTIGPILDSSNAVTLSATQSFNNTGQLVNLPVDIQTIKGQAVVCSAGVTVLASVGTAGTSVAQTGDSYGRIGVNGAGLTSLGDSRLANLDATVSSRSTFAGGAVASVTAAVTVSDKTGFKLAVDGLDVVLVESGVNIRQACSVIAAMAAGAVSGAPVGPIVIKGLGVSTTRITATVDASGNRTGVALTLPA